MIFHSVGRALAWYYDRRQTGGMKTSYHEIRESDGAPDRSRCHEAPLMMALIGRSLEILGPRQRAVIDRVYGPPHFGRIKLNTYAQGMLGRAEGQLAREFERREIIRCQRHP